MELTRAQKTELPLGEAAEGYEIDIGNGAAVVGTVYGLTAPASICAVALQSADFGAPVSGHLTVRSAQTGGLGRGRSTNLPRPVVGCSLCRSGRQIRAEAATLRGWCRNHLAG